MKKLLFAFMALLLVAGAAYSQKPKKMVIPKLPGPKPEPLLCDQLRTGTFKTTLNGKVTTMIRNAKTETDYLDGNTTNPANYTVKWTGECEYVLTPTAETYKKHPEIPKGAIFTMHTYSRNTNSWTVTITTNYAKGMTNMDVYKVK